MTRIRSSSSSAYPCTDWKSVPYARACMPQKVARPPIVPAPPRKPYFSMSRVERPARDAAVAAIRPAGPPPMMTTSYSPMTGMSRAGFVDRVVGRLFSHAVSLRSAVVHRAGAQHGAAGQGLHERLVLVEVAAAGVAVGGGHVVGPCGEFGRIDQQVDGAALDVDVDQVVVVHAAERRAGCGGFGRHLADREALVDEAAELPVGDEGDLAGRARARAGRR